MFEIKDRGLEFEMAVTQFLITHKIGFEPEPVICCDVGVKGRKIEDKRVYRPDWRVFHPFEINVYGMLEATVHKGNPWGSPHKKGQRRVAEAAGFFEIIATITPPQLEQILNISTLRDRRIEFFGRIMGFKF